MAPEPVEHKLAAILSADVVGYSRLMTEDEVGTVRTLNACRDEMGVLIRQHRGRIVDALREAMRAGGDSDPEEILRAERSALAGSLGTRADRST